MNVNTNVLKTAMNILVDIRPLMDARYSGVAEYTLELLQALLEIDTKNQYTLFYNSFQKLDNRLPSFSQPHVKIVATRIPNKIFNYPFLKLLGRPYFDRLTKEKVDLIFLPHLNFAAWSKKTPTVLTVHDLSFIKYPEFFSFRKNVWHWFLGVKRLLKRVDHVITLAENTKADIVSYSNVSKESVSVIYSGISKVFRKLETEDSQLKTIKEKYNLPNQFLLFLGTVEPRKNLQTLIIAFELLKDSGNYPDLGLVIAGGKGWKSKPIYKQAHTSRYARDIKFLDYVPAEEKVYLYNLATIFVYPSFYEGFGFPPLEAMACGIPTIVSASSSLPEVVEKSALMIDPYNARSISVAISGLLQDNELYNHFVSTSQEQAKKFSWAKAAEYYLALFERLASK